MWSRRFEGRGLAALLLFASFGCSISGNPSLPSDAPRVAIETDLGTIVVGLYEQTAPVTVRNFLGYVDAGFYDGTVFHRVIPGFMIQGGGYVHQNDRYLLKDTLPSIPLEADKGLKNLRGTLAMARLDMPDTATAQFFINLADNQRLDPLGEVSPGYAVFGTVLEGMGIVDAIAAVDVGLRPPFPEPATPLEDVVIRSVRRLD